MPLVSAGQALASKALGAYPNYGLSMRFEVTVDALKTTTSLGLWQTCDGLKMDMKYAGIEQGGVYSQKTSLPDKLTYGSVKLKRAIDPQGSPALQSWLQGYVSMWGGTLSATSVTISLLDYQLNEVISWTLSEAYPTSWTGPSLNADGKTVAIEELVLEYQGITVGKPLPVPAGGKEQAATAPMSAYLYPKGTEKETSGVKLQFNPTSIKVSHAVAATQVGVEATEESDGFIKPIKAQTGSTENLSLEQEYQKSGLMNISLSGMWFDGATVLNSCGTLLSWSYLSLVADPTTSVKKTALPQLVFSWGNFMLGANTVIGGNIPVTMVKATVDYVRFSANGTPNRANVSLDLQVFSPNPMKQNPTSGGLPGRNGHTVTSGESLPSIAVTTYGSPGHWRTLAEANQLDDPLRVHPGATLYLPTRAELADRSRG
jgi:phage tail-like protein